MNVVPSMVIQPTSENDNLYMDFKGRPRNGNYKEILCIGTKSGNVYFLDTFHRCRIISVFQAHQDPLLNIHYRCNTSELFTVSKNPNNGLVHLKVWQLPDLTCICNINCYKDVCLEPSSTFALSQTTNH